jgi:putative FmdB family regulatory protein
MPLFDFRCRRCDQVFEALVRAGTTPACASCGGVDLEQLPSSFGMSSASIRKGHLDKARKKGAEARTNKLRADHDYMHKHLKDDH